MLRVLSRGWRSDKQGPSMLLLANMCCCSLVVSPAVPHGVPGALREGAQSDFSMHLGMQEYTA